MELRCDISQTGKPANAAKPTKLRNHNTKHCQKNHVTNHSQRWKRQHPLDLLMNVQGEKLKRGYKVGDVQEWKVQQNGFSDLEQSTNQYLVSAIHINVILNTKEIFSWETKSRERTPKKSPEFPFFYTALFNYWVNKLDIHKETLLTMIKEGIIKRTNDSLKPYLE